MKNVKLLFIAFMLITAGFVGAASADTYPVRGVFNWEHQDWYLMHNARGSLYPSVYYNSSSSSAWVDTSDQLHLTIRSLNNSTWECAQAQSQYDYLYGTYTFTVKASDGGTPIDELDNQTAIGLFLYENDTNEIDIEFLQHSSPTDAGKKLWFTVQPWQIAENINGYPLNMTGDTVTTQIIWEPTYITWNAWQEDGTLIATTTTYNVSKIPRNPMNLKVAFSTRGNMSDGDNTTQEILITNMSVTGNVTVTAPVYSGANTYTNILNHSVSPDIDPSYTDVVNATLTPTQTLSPYGKYNTTGLQLWYKLDEPTHVAQYISDSSGNGYHGELSHLKWQQSGNQMATPFKYNSGITFDGANDYIDVPETLVGNSNLTFAVYLNYTNSSKTSADLITQSTVSNNRTYEFMLNGTTPGARLGDGTYHADAVHMFTNMVIPTNVKTYVVYTVAGSNVTLYTNNGTGWNSQSVTASTTLRTVDNNKMRIGGTTSNYPHQFFQGSMDNIMIWNRTLGASEIYAMYNDTTSDVYAKTNSNETSGSIDFIPVSESDDNISSVMFSVPTYTTIDGVTVYDYSKSVTAFTALVSASYLPPSAGFTDDVDRMQVQFTDDSSRTMNRTWDFGDGNTSNETNPTHTYFASGRYTVTLTATSTHGSDTVSHVVEVGDIGWTRAREDGRGSDTWVTSLGLIGAIVLIHFVSRLIQTIRGSVTEEGGDGGINWLMVDLLLLLMIIVAMGTLTYVLDSIRI